MTDEKLIRRVLSKGDRAAADELVQRYYDEMYRYAYRQSAGQSSTKEAAQDLTQEIFISALRSLATFNPKKASFRTWLYRVANSRIIDSHRRFKLLEVQIDETAIFDTVDLTEDVANADLLQKIEGHISVFPSDAQRIFRLHLYGEMTFAQIAQALDMPEATVKTKFYRMVKQVKEVFRDEYHPAQSW